jgi:hypothetical protein
MDDDVTHLVRLGPLDENQPSLFDARGVLKIPDDPNPISWIKPSKFRNIELWSHFGLHPDASTHKFTWCFDCSKWVPRSGGNTSSLSLHFDVHTEEEAKQAKQQSKKRPLPSDQTDLVTSFKRQKNQLSIFQNQSSYVAGASSRVRQHVN